MPKKVYKTKLKSADKKQTTSSLSELTDAVIQLLDRQDKYDDAVLKLQHKQERLQNTFDNLIEVLNTNSKDSIFFTEELKLMGTKMNELQTFVRLKSATHTDTIDKLEQRMNYTVNLTNAKLSIVDNRIFESEQKFDALYNSHVELYKNNTSFIQALTKSRNTSFFKRIFNKP